MSAGPFILVDFLRLAAPNLLDELLALLNIPHSEPMASLRSAPDKLIRFVEQLSASQRETLEAECRNVHYFACREGLDALRIVGATLNDLNWNLVLNATRRTFRDRALAARILFPQLFRQAIPCLDLQLHSSFRRGTLLPDTDPILTEEVIRKLESRLETFFMTKQSRGAVCTVEVSRWGDLICLHAAPDDYAAEALCHTPDRKLRRRTVRPTFRVLYAIDRAQCRASLDAPLGPKQLEELEAIFLEYLYPDTPVGHTVPIVCQTQRLLDDNLRLRTDPKDGVSIHVRTIKLELPGNYRLQLASPPDGDFHHALAALRYNCDKLRSVARVARAELAFAFIDAAGRKEKTCIVPLTPQNVPSLLNLEPHRARLIEKYLVLKGFCLPEQFPHYQKQPTTECQSAQLPDAKHNAEPDPADASYSLDPTSGCSSRESASDRSSRSVRPTRT